MAMPWAAAPTQREQLAIEDLRAIAAIDTTSAALMLTFPWIADGLTKAESGAISRVQGIAGEDAELAWAVLNLGWVSDDMSWMETHALNSLRDLARSDLALAWQVIRQPFVAPPFRQRDEYALKAFSDMSEEPPGVTKGAELLLQLGTYEWFNDGLDDREAVLLFAIAISPKVFQQALLQAHYVESAVVQLPLGRQVDITVVRHTPFPEGDQSLTALEEGMRVIEDFMGVPFPVGEVILIVAEPEIWQVGSGRFVGSLIGGAPEPAYLTAFILSSSSESGPASGALYHEISHHYQLSGHPWLSEGAAQFLEAYTLDRLGMESIDRRIAHLNEGGCGRENIAAHIREYGGEQCTYYLGERFFHAVYQVLGQDAVAAALRELYFRSMHFEFLDEDAIYHAFRANTPPGRMEDFNAVYRRHHGGFAIDSSPEVSLDRSALFALYNAVGGEQWKEDGNWTSSAPLGAWYGVSTEVGGRVRLLDLSANQLNGQLPSTLGNLSDLRELWFDDNELTGPIPAELGTLSELVVLSLGRNRLSGQIPSELGDLPKVGAIYLFENQLTGEIPPNLGNAASLQQLDLVSNRLIGTIPAQIGRLSNLRSLALSQNQLSGQIPPELGGLLNLTRLDLRSNQLSGAIPHELGNLTELETLNLSDNQLSGEIPAVLAGLSNLGGLYLAGNRFTGCIPEGLRDVPDNDFAQLSLPFCGIAPS